MLLGQQINVVYSSRGNLMCFPWPLNPAQRRISPTRTIVAHSIAALQMIAFALASVRLPRGWKH